MAKKRQLQSQLGMPNIAQGPTARYNEMKLETPDPVSFHDIVHFSNLMSGPPPAFASMDPRPLPESADQSSRPAFAQAQRERNRMAGATQEHHPDEAGFLEQINEVLGPMPPNDPLAELLDLS